MLSSPYPVPSLKSWRAAMITGWLAGVAAGVWVIVEPPKPYEGIGLTLTTAWGVMLAVGSALCVAGHVLRRYQVEVPGLVLALGGIVIYDFLSWQQTLGDSLGSGPRALLLILLAAWIIARLRVLLHIDRQVHRIVKAREGAT